MELGMIAREDGLEIKSLTTDKFDLGWHMMDVKFYTEFLNFKGTNLLGEHEAIFY